MLILVIRSHCKVCPLPTIPISRNCTVANCSQCSNFTMRPDEQNQHFVELRRRVCLYIHALVFLRVLPSLEGKNSIFLWEKEEKAVSQTYVRQTMVLCRNE